MTNSEGSKRHSTVPRYLSVDTPTVLDRMLAAGIPDDRAHQHLTAGRVWVDGETVTDPDTPAPPPARITIAGS